jgi:hypothetical protein
LAERNEDEPAMALDRHPQDGRKPVEVQPPNCRRW